MSYVVLARKYRPQTFSDLVGQEHVARTLHNAIATGRVAHAFLFTGVRGVGKTTSARILAKALNCLGDPDLPPEQRPTGPSAEPCLKCASCQEITEGRDLDVQEIDAASHTGVDQIRDLQSYLSYPPARDRFRVVIVDEVHMLSKNAWNAFLKTLEEPPPHLKFILATTEVHQVPVTILSRVQRFDFKMISAAQVGTRLRQVLDAEGLTYDDTAISLLSRQSAGSMRDGMSLLDQAIAASPERLDGEQVALALGIASHAALLRLAEAVANGQGAETLRLVQSLCNQGFEPARLARDFLGTLRDLVVCRTCESPAALLDGSAEEAADLIALSARFEQDDLLRLHQGFAKSFDDIVRGPNPRIGLEMTLVRLSRRPPLLSLQELLVRLGAMEKRLRGDLQAVPNAPRVSPGQSGPRPMHPAAPPAAANHAPPPSHPMAPRAPQSAPPAPAAPRSDEDPDPAAGRRAAERPTVERPATMRTAGEHAATAASPPRVEGSTNQVPQGNAHAAATPPRSAPPGNAAASAQPRSAPQGGVTAPAQVNPPPSAGSTTSPAATSAPPSAGPRPSAGSSPSAAPHDQLPDSIAPTTLAPPPPSQLPELAAPTPEEERWEQLVEELRETRGELAAFLEHAQVIDLSPERVSLGWEKDSIFVNAATAPTGQEALLEVLRRTFGREPAVEHRRDYVSPDPRPTLAQRRVVARELRRRQAHDEARNHPTVKDAERILGARVKAVRLPDE